MSSESTPGKRARRPPTRGELDRFDPAADTSLPEEFGGLIGRTRRLVWSSAQRALHAQGESMLTMQLLMRLTKHGAMTQIELAQATAQHPAGISRLLEELEKDGLIRRARDPNDRRKLRVEATAKAKARLRAARPLISEAVDEVLEVLSADEKRALRAILTKIIAHHQVRGR